jgi:hypothetical protein
MGQAERLWQILLQKPKIERPGESRESRFLDAPAAARSFGREGQFLNFRFSEISLANGTQISSLIRTVPSRKRGVAQRHQRGAGCGGRCWRT